MFCPSCTDNTDAVEMVPVIDVHPWSSEATASAVCPCCGYTDSCVELSALDMAFA